MGFASYIVPGQFWNRIYDKGISDSFFKSKEEKIPFEIKEYRISVDDCNNRIKLIMRDGTRTYVRDFFKNSQKLIFSRFFICEEELLKPQFAPSLEEAINWFTGKGHPKDGYRLASWKEGSKRKCSFCETTLSLPFHIKKIECLIIYSHIPEPRKMVGWRVSEVESELGIGILTKYFTIEGDHPVVKWDSFEKKIICEGCAGRFAENYRQDELDNFIILKGG
jgi:hypothetical protein